MKDARHPAGDEAGVSNETAGKRKLFDPTLQAAARLDRLLEALPRWGRVWAVRYLQAKYLGFPPQEEPQREDR